MSDTVGIKTL